jgi:hypothetical protein
MKKYGTARQATDDNIIRCICIACWITERLQTQTQNMEFSMLFHGKNGYTNVPHCYVIHTVPVLLTS